MTNIFSAMIEQKKYLLSFAALISFIVIFHRLSETPLSSDECFYSEISKEMAVTGDFLTPQYGYKADFHHGKPPVVFWLQAAAGSIFGFNAFAMRLPSAALGFLCVLAAMVFAERYFGHIVSFLTAVILTFTQQYLFHARSALTDVAFAAFFTFAVLSFWAARAEGRNIFYYSMGLFVGLAVMTRQAAGFLPFFIFGAFAVLGGETDFLKNPHFYAGASLSAAIFLPWHILMIMRHGDLFLSQYFGVAVNFALKGGNTHVNPWYEYFRKILENYWPWLPFLAVGLYKQFKGAVSVGTDDIERRKKIFLLTWGLLPLVIFQIAKVKHARFIVPVYVPFSLICAVAIAGFRDALKIRITVALAAVSAILAALYLVFPVIPKTLDNRELEDTVILIPAVKKTDSGDIFIINNHKYWDYRNCLWFYADKNTLGLSSGGMADKIRLKEKGYFLMLKDDYAAINEATKNIPKRIIASSRDSVLFSDCDAPPTAGR